MKDVILYVAPGILDEVLAILAPSKIKTSLWQNNFRYFRVSLSETSFWIMLV